MDTSYTYCNREGTRVMVYAPPSFEPEDVLTLTDVGGQPVMFMRLSDRSLECGDVATRENAKGEIVQVTGSCTSFECHRKVLGECQCGRHAYPVPFSRAERKAS